MDWISVKDRLPNNGQIVLTYSMNTISVNSDTLECPVLPSIFEVKNHHKDGEGEFGRYHDHIKGDKLVPFYMPYITHWMPMPEFK